MATVCPVSGERTDQNVCRVVAGLITVLVVVGVAFVSEWVFVALAVDFLVRGFLSPRKSPVRAVAAWLVGVLGLKAAPTDIAPKRFAARIGFVFCVSAVVLLAVGFSVAANAVAGVLGVCALLESALGFCVGCEVYGLMPRRLAERLAG